MHTAHMRVNDFESSKLKKKKAVYPVSVAFSLYLRLSKYMHICQRKTNRNPSTVYIGHQTNLINRCAGNQQSLSSWPSDTIVCSVTWNSLLKT